MGGEEKKRPGTTKRFTREELAELAARARGDDPEASDDSAGVEAPPITPMSRSVTLHDPLTTQLLAEVARRVQTTEFDVDRDALAVQLEDEGSGPTHPHALRRKT
jgi:hypothetical protein